MGKKIEPRWVSDSPWAQSLIGDNKLLEKVCCSLASSSEVFYHESGLSAKHFSDPDYREIWGLIGHMYERQKPLSWLMQSIYDAGHLGVEDWIDDVDLRAIRAKVFDRHVTEKDAEKARDEILERYRSASMYQLARSLTGELRGCTDSSEMRTLVIETIEKIYHEADGASGKTVSELVSMAIESAKEPKERAGIIPTGIECINPTVHGHRKRMVSLVGARQGHGKSTYFLQTAINAAAKGHGVVFMATEDSELDTGMRALSFSTKSSVEKFNSGQATENDFEVAKNGAEVFKPAFDNIIFCETKGMTARQIAARARVLSARLDNCGMVILDYVQMIESERGTPRNEAYEDAMRVFNRCASDLDVAFVVGSQFVKGEAGTYAKPPSLDELKGSSALLDIPKFILFIHRPFKDQPDDDDEIMVYVPKNNHGQSIDTVARWTTAPLMIGNRVIEPRCKKIQDKKRTNKQGGW